MIISSGHQITDIVCLASGIAEVTGEHGLIWGQTPKVSTATVRTNASAHIDAQTLVFASQHLGFVDTVRADVPMGLITETIPVNTSVSASLQTEKC